MNLHKQENHAEALIQTLRIEQNQLEIGLPKNSEIVATVTFVNEEKLRIISAEARDTEIIVLVGIRGSERQTVTVITRYSFIAQCVFSIEKLKPSQKPIRLGFGPPSKVSEAESS